MHPIFRSVLLVGLISSAVVLSACKIATPIEGPGPDQSARTVIVSVTHAQLNDERKVFFDRAGEVLESLEGRDGYVGSSIRRSLSGNEAWTMTAWRDEIALRNFQYDEVHARAVREGERSMTAFRTVRFEIPAQQWPLNWDAALAEVAKKPLTIVDASTTPDLE